MLRNGSTNRVIRHNIGLLMREGFSHKQAVAIAYRKAGRSKFHPTKKKKTIHHDTQAYR